MSKRISISSFFAILIYLASSYHIRPNAILAAPYLVTETPASFPQECRRPEDDYSKTTIRGMVINKRTYEMLKYAATLYGGEIDITDKAITQGSYSSSVKESFGTHTGGGAVDISVIASNRARYTILYNEIEPLIRAMRLAGFAAWFRKPGELGPGSPLHIHAIAIGDKELSKAAQEQLIGESGYFRGFNGLPTHGELPVTDAHNGPILCQWMVDLGYSDLR